MRQNLFADRIFAIAVAMVALVAVECSAQPTKADATSRPNIIFVMADDLGWMDLHCQGNERLDTPHLDRLAADGMRFTDAYAAAPVCSPTRAAVLTGLAPARLHITNHIPDQARFVPDDATLMPAEMLDHLPLEQMTIAEKLQEAGYATGFFGKWHLCGKSGREGRGLEAFYPRHQGFDLNVGGCAYGGPPSFFDPYRIHTLSDRQQGEYLPDRLADEVIHFIDSTKNQPFFVSLWNYAVHWPMEAPPNLIKKYESRVGPGVKDPRYAAMIEALDASLGKMFAALDERELKNETLVVFTSDNGPFLGVADAKPLRSGKGYLFEGGVRVPLIVRWPGVVPAGTSSNEPVISMDFFPTFLEAAGIHSQSAAPRDGVSLMPVLRQTGALPRDALYFHYPNYAFHRSNRLGSAIRQGRYKLIEWFDDSTVELYDLQEDLSESHNLAAGKPELADSLKRRLAAWRNEVGAVVPRPK